MILGMINGGLGLQLAANYTFGVLIVYSCVAVLMFVVYISVISLHFAKQRRVARRAAWWEETRISRPHSTQSARTSKNDSRHELTIQPASIIPDQLKTEGQN